MSIPLMVTLPTVGVSIPQSTLSNVVLPAPLAPIIPISFPEFSDNETSLNPKYPLSNLTNRLSALNANVS
jgi:hypothetical protein